MYPWTEPPRPVTQNGGRFLVIVLAALALLLFTGTITRGQTRSFRAGRIYARFGNASAFDARLNGKRLGLPPGTYSAVVTTRGLADVTAG